MPRLAEKDPMGAFHCGGCRAFGPPHQLIDFLASGARIALLTSADCLTQTLILIESTTAGGSQVGVPVTGPLHHSRVV